MRIYEAIEKAFMTIAPLDVNEQKELGEAVRSDYVKVNDSYRAKIAHNEACVKKDSEAQRNHVKDYKPEPKKVLTFQERAIHFLENPYVRYGIWALFVFGVPALKRYLRRMQDDIIGDSKDDNSPMAMFLKFEEFQKMQNKLL